MEHKSFDELSRNLEDAKTKIQLNKTYQHYKTADSRYTVKGFAISEATNEVMVRYYSHKQPDVEFVRPLSEWIEKVSWQSKTLPRFKQL